MTCAGSYGKNLWSQETDLVSDLVVRCRKCAHGQAWGGGIRTATERLLAIPVGNEGTLRAPLGFLQTPASRGLHLQSCPQAVCLPLGARGRARCAGLEEVSGRDRCSGDSLADQSRAPAEAGPVRGAPHPHARFSPSLGAFLSKSLARCGG